MNYQKAYQELFDTVTKVLHDLHRSQVDSFQYSLEGEPEEKREEALRLRESRDWLL